MRKITFLTLLAMTLTTTFGQSNQYKNFRVAVYSRSYETAKMGDREYIEPIWDLVTQQVKVDKIYLETHRDLLIVDQETLDKAKAFFAEKGVETAGGITLTVDESNRFETFCYTNPEHRKKVKEIIEHTARNFDELILDDFFFTSCKCELCVEAKGNKSWTDYRLELMKEATVSLVLEPAKAVNPNCKVVIKYPNWYEHFQGLGFNLEVQPSLFHGLYTGTETRDPSGNQHLQAYLGYLIFRYFENLKPGGNGGGWVDTGGLRYMDRYAEQLWITMFAKAPEITLFDIRQLQYPIRENLRASWQGQGTSFDFDEMMKPIKTSSGTEVKPTTLARTAGVSLEKVDKFLDKLGNPIGVKSYKPYHSVGEDFLQNYMGMIGIPMDLVPEFPENEKMVFLTESAAFDGQIVDKIKKHLRKGNSVMITSGLLKALQDKGIHGIAEIRYTNRKALVRDFSAGWGIRAKSDRDILIPQIAYLTNDSWEEISALDDTNGWPILHTADYGKGKLFVLTIPENFVDLYHFPEPVITRIKQTLTAEMPVVLEGPGYTSLYVYDNNTCIVQSFADTTIQVRLVAGEKFTSVRNLETNALINSAKREIPQRGKAPRVTQVFDLEIRPHSFVALKIEP
jgi:hypothetical protein